ncbi:uncharacterized protein BXZ73DRAFT_81063 [Epithele typhae]|uniref:uncharacterized protein n=1 Tax=Epithele typhae TaxID=378194 RepID=UPI002008184D|nr:uncharacterized protein BXZ73DRAFT_81063 [Epithele typhae]KAH9916616.1 hypothetical protein BXZ73DRAFT_81063 [Epithele typhae]
MSTLQITDGPATPACPLVVVPLSQPGRILSVALPPFASSRHVGTGALAYVTTSLHTTAEQPLLAGTSRLQSHPHIVSPARTLNCTEGAYVVPSSGQGSIFQSSRGAQDRRPARITGPHDLNFLQNRRSPRTEHSPNNRHPDARRYSQTISPPRPVLRSSPSGANSCVLLSFGSAMIFGKLTELATKDVYHLFDVEAVDAPSGISSDGLRPTTSLARYLRIFTAGVGVLGAGDPAFRLDQHVRHARCERACPCMLRVPEQHSSRDGLQAARQTSHNEALTFIGNHGSPGTTPTLSLTSSARGTLISTITMSAEFVGDVSPELSLTGGVPQRGWLGLLS